MAKDILLLLLCYVAFFISQFHFAYTTNVTCIESERQALLEFKGSLIDGGANRLASWTAAGEDCCNWAGITCNPRTGHVHKLHLRNPIQRYWDQYTDNSDSYDNNSLGGQINPSILNLEHLTYLDLSSNDFSGIQIPKFLGSLRKLRYLNLSNAGFASEIPPHLGNLSILQYLDLGSSQLHAKSLNWIIRLTSLKALDLSEADLTECVDCLYSIGMIPSLSSLSLRGCGIVVGTAFSPDLSPILNLTSLVSLDLGSNDLSNSSILLPLLNLSSQLVVLKLDHISSGVLIPIQLEKLTALTVLDLSGDYFNSTSMLRSLCNHTNLVYLGLGYNQFQGSLPLCLGNLTSLRVLDLSQNQLSDVVPSTLGQLTMLQNLDLAGNNFGGKIPNELGYLKQLTSLILSENQLSNVIPSTLSQLTKLQNLDLARNNFGGKIPNKLGCQLTKLQNLDLARNNFGGKIPNKLGYLKQLTSLSLSENQLSGVVPSTLGQLTKLQQLDISDNSLTGELSESHFEKLKSLKYLSLSNNYFLSLNVSPTWTPPFQLQTIAMDSILLGSQFPPWLRTQRYVVDLYMSNSSISGVIPTWFTSWSSVNNLDLSNNKIEGSSISFPPNIQRLYLSNNLLTGVLSLDTNYLTNVSLEYFLLDDNHLTGAIPVTLCNLRSLRQLLLDNNQLTGIPLCLGNLSSLVSLSLANNQLAGRIPSCFRLSLSILSLANNQLTGRIPLWFGNLVYLQVLDLSNNSFSGHIPSTLGNLTSLFLLHLSRNKLSGVLPSSLKNLTNLQTLDLGENQLTGTIPEWIGEEFSSLQFLRLESNKFYGNISMSLCQLPFQILNLAENNLDGPIPRCFGNLTRMQPLYVDRLREFSYDYSDTLWNVMKGVELQYFTGRLDDAVFISLSTNKLQGEIPKELMDIQRLKSLNLSNNKLSGRIPENIGKLKKLESLDLAMNQLSGTIPQSLANIDTLSFLNLSFNNLVGRIPSGSHFDTLGVDQSIYEGNNGLCGKPLENSCPDDGTSKGKGRAIQVNIDEGFELLWFYAGIAPGFAVGSVGVFCILYFKKSWRHAYFGFLERICGRVWVAFAVKFN